jgi:small subunit ribosomal protein S20
MPITKSVKKALQSSERKRVFNLRRKERMKNARKDIHRLLQEKKGAEAQALIPRAYKAIDKAAKRGVIKDNTAARKKSRLVKVINKNS